MNVISLIGKALAAVEEGREMSLEDLNYHQEDIWLFQEHGKDPD